MHGVLICRSQYFDLWETSERISRVQDPGLLRVIGDDSVDAQIPAQLKILRGIDCPDVHGKTVPAAV